MRILFVEPKDYSKKALAIYQSLGELVFDNKPHSDADIIVVRLAYKIDKSWM